MFPSRKNLLFVVVRPTVQKWPGVHFYPITIDKPQLIDFSHPAASFSLPHSPEAQLFL